MPTIFAICASMVVAPVRSGTTATIEATTPSEMMASRAWRSVPVPAPASMSVSSVVKSTGVSGGNSVRSMPVPGVNTPPIVDRSAMMKGCFSSRLRKVRTPTWGVVAGMKRLA